ncbi:succinate dehydrogenase assembly factor 2, mitochondrial isoform X2 [Amborella trichopoda]|uniref:succinate dehydrogenase assembly factor 2, mitochondrial isoform X2 n=1 Tax=Amborella trichopoda TaxID=13333 RepID=UPI0005D2E981|nr:succinate dehydrogenase assembly factor 2, mitochondrial isoform X2 [Amborella trichopoda]|eukprot:XP_011623462.1 succinate dehydrogenase assembly factor 2, mitochondrial isoform X2 [Amborella trichopoda]
MASLKRALLSLNKTMNPLFMASLSTRNPHSSLYTVHQGSVSWFSSESGLQSLDLSNEESRRRNVNRLLYRSKQRGFLELDLVLGRWVEENIKTMDEANIKALVEVLDLVFSAVHTKISGNLKSYASAETRAAPGQPWVRGWDDKRGLGTTPFGNQ